MSPLVAGARFQVCGRDVWLGVRTLSCRWYRLSCLRRLLNCVSMVALARLGWVSDRSAAGTTAFTILSFTPIVAFHSYLRFGKSPLCS